MPPITKIVEAVILPPGLLLVLLAAGLVFGCLKRYRILLWLTAGAILLGYLLSITPVCDLLLRPLEGRYPPLSLAAAQSAHPSAVVVLSGGLVPISPEMKGEASPAPGYLKRLLYAASLARRLGLPLIISGGPVPNTPGTESEAEAGESALFAFGIHPPRVMLEEKSQDTWQNAADIEHEYHPRRVVLVTSAYHMPRAMYAFARNGIEAIPAPTDYKVWRAGYSLVSFFPSADSLLSSAVGIKEWVGLLYYHLMPRG